MSCQSSLTLTGALASYDIPEQQVNRGMPQWLNRCIAEAAKHLDEAPFLQLLVDLKKDRFQHHSVSHAVLQVRLHRPFVFIVIPSKHALQCASHNYFSLTAPYSLLFHGPAVTSVLRSILGDLQAPQLWQGIAEHLAQSSPEVLLLIHPINMTSSHSQRALSVCFHVTF